MTFPPPGGITLVGSKGPPDLYSLPTRTLRYPYEGNPLDVPFETLQNQLKPYGGDETVGRGLAPAVRYRKFD